MANQELVSAFRKMDLSTLGHPHRNHQHHHDIGDYRQEVVAVVGNRDNRRFSVAVADY